MVWEVLVIYKRGQISTDAIIFNDDRLGRRLVKVRGDI